jgi:hypothetical protein
MAVVTQTSIETTPITVGSTITVPPGTPASVENTGTVKDVVLEFKIPVGALLNIDGGFADTNFVAVDVVDAGGA